MATLILKTNKAEASDGFHSIIFDFQEPPFPKRELEIKTTAEAIAARDAYVKEAAATGKSMVVWMTIAKKDRSPNGFKQASENVYVNC